jgi:hypothetical protein
VSDAPPASDFPRFQGPQWDDSSRGARLIARAAAVRQNVARLNRERQGWVHSRVTCCRQRWLSERCESQNEDTRTGPGGPGQSYSLTGTRRHVCASSLRHLPSPSAFGARCFRLLFVSIPCVTNSTIPSETVSCSVFWWSWPHCSSEALLSLRASSFVQSLAHYRISVSWTSTKTSVVFGSA